MNELLSALRAVAEPTRLRIVAALQTTELTVGDVCKVLAQSQPRVSRHLKLLCEAGVLERHAQGTSAFYRRANNGLGRELVDALDALTQADDPQLIADQQRVDMIRAGRAAAAAEYFETIAADWDGIRATHVADEAVEAAMLDVFNNARAGDLLDIGTGTGRVLEVFADRIHSGLGIDLSTEMLNLARSRLDQHGLRHCAVRHGNGYDLQLDTGTFDTAVLHHVLHFLDDPASAITEAARTLRADGTLLIVDFAPHELDVLATDFAHQRLGFTTDEIERYCIDAGLHSITSTHLDPPPGADPKLVVSLWTATQAHDAPSTYPIDRSTRLDIAS